LAIEAGDVSTAHDLLTQAAADLAAISDSPALDAELLLAHVLGKSRSVFRAMPELEISMTDSQHYSALINRRKNREPVAYIVGHKEFWTLDLLVNQHTLVPRPETELLVETALGLFDEHEKIQAADLGTGSGAIALSLASERPHWQIDAVDISQNALQVASNNAQRLGIRNVSFYEGCWLTALPARQYQLIVSNPPYISEAEWPEYQAALAAEARSALVSGADGLDAIRAITVNASQYLTAGGYLLLEHGYAQGAAVRAILEEAGFHKIHTLVDLAGLDRATLGRL
jgi:release factor glutamine methyltransferase